MAVLLLLTSVVWGLLEATMMSRAALPLLLRQFDWWFVNGSAVAYATLAAAALLDSPHENGWSVAVHVAFALSGALWVTMVDASPTRPRLVRLVGALCALCQGLRWFVTEYVGAGRLRQSQRSVCIVSCTTLATTAQNLLATLLLFAVVSCVRIYMGQLIVLCATPQLRFLIAASAFDGDDMTARGAEVSGCGDGDVVAAESVDGPGLYGSATGSQSAPAPVVGDGGGPTVG